MVVRIKSEVPLFSSSGMKVSASATVRQYAQSPNSNGHRRKSIRNNDESYRFDGSSRFLIRIQGGFRAACNSANPFCPSSLVKGNDGRISAAGKFLKSILV